MSEAFIVFSGANDRAVLGFLRSLKACGERIVIVARTRTDRVLLTSYRRHVVYVRPDNSLTVAMMAEAIGRAREATGLNKFVVLPSSEFFNFFLYDHRAELESMGFEIPLPSVDVYRRLTDKADAGALFFESGFTCPASITCPDSARVPFVAKPRQNVDKAKTLYPKLIMSDSDRGDLVHDDSRYFFQEFVDGASYYLLFYLDKTGKFSICASQENVAQQSGGKSQLIVKCADLENSPLAQKTSALLRKEGYYGPVMVEFIRRDGVDYFIEVNPRVWGPIQLCLDNGIGILRAFIGECLYDNPRRFEVSERVHRKRPYYWLAGMMDEISSSKAIRWYGPRPSSFRLLFEGLSNDVYLRPDSFLCFLKDFVSKLIPFTCQLTRKAFDGRIR